MEPEKPAKKRPRTLSPVWIIPIIAALLGGWLMLRTWQETGTEIEIVFDSASDIVVGQTEIRLKDVPVGKVTGLSLNDDLSKVRVQATVDRQVSKHLSENTRFWLVSPRVSTSGISNLGTLISGVYIVMDPGKPGDSRYSYDGLEEPPAVQSDDLGSQFVLLAEDLGSLDIGSPVYFRQLKVGEVTGYRLGPRGQNVEIRIFVNAPYDRQVQTRSRFWNVSGLGISLGSDGFKAEMASLASLISGGVAFENGVGFDPPARAESDHEFYLYNDRDAVLEGRFSLKYFYLLKFTHSVRGLQVGAPVEYRGFKVGEVIDITLDSVEQPKDALHVYISMEPQRLDDSVNPSRAEFDDLLESLVDDGLHAQIKSGSLITGSRFIDLTYPRRRAPGEFVRQENYAELPTLEHPFDQLEQQMAHLMATINRLPIKKMGEDLSSSFASLSQILKTLEEQNTALKVDKTLANVSVASEELEMTMVEAKAALQELNRTLRSMDATFSPDSQTQYELNETLQSVKSAAQSLRTLMERLNEKPDALIFGN